MAIITFTSDFGFQDHYVAAVKAKIFLDNPQVQIIDLTHEVPTFNLMHAAFVLRAIYSEFPVGTVHLVSLQEHRFNPVRFIAAKINNQFFVLPDNGMLSLISDTPPDMAVEIIWNDKQNLSFPAKNILAKAAAQLARGIDITNIGKPLIHPKRSLMLQPKAGKSGIFGQVIYVDKYGNLITNIRQNVFEDILKLVGPAYEIQFSKESTRQLSKHYGEVNDGDIAVLFNDLGLLEIAIRDGNAAQLLGLRYDSPVRILFQ